MGGGRSKADKEREAFESSSVVPDTSADRLLDTALAAMDAEGRSFKRIDLDVIMVGLEPNDLRLLIDCVRLSAEHLEDTVGMNAGPVTKGFHQSLVRSTLGSMLAFLQEQLASYEHQKAGVDLVSGAFEPTDP